VATAEDAAKDVQAFISIVCPRFYLPEAQSLSLTKHQFFEAFKEFEGREFHMAGESYGVSRVESCLSHPLGCAGLRWVCDAVDTDACVSGPIPPALRVRCCRRQQGAHQGGEDADQPPKRAHREWDHRFLWVMSCLFHEAVRSPLTDPSTQSRPWSHTTPSCVLSIFQAQVSD
jgi:hypothetical protein